MERGEGEGYWWRGVRVRGTIVGGGGGGEDGGWSSTGMGNLEMSIFSFHICFIRGEEREACVYETKLAVAHRMCR